MPVDKCLPTKEEKTEVKSIRCLPQIEDCDKKQTWLKRIDSEYKCPFDKSKPEEPPPPIRVPDSKCPEGPYRDPIIKKCPIICECYPDQYIDDSWRGNPKDFCFFYKNRYRNLRNPKTNLRCQELMKRQQALLKAMREQAEKDMIECRKKAARPVGSPPKLECSGALNVDYTFTQCLCAKCDLQRRIAAYLTGGLGCKPVVPKCNREAIPGCTKPFDYPCNKYYNPRKKDKCACKCGCLEKISELYKMQNKKKV